MKYGLPDNTLQRLLNLISSKHAVTEIVLFGSRAKGTYKPFSDIDLALKGNSLNRNDLIQLSLEIDDLLLPYQVDVLLSHTLNSPDLIKEISETGIVLWSRNQDS